MRSSWIAGATLIAGLLAPSLAAQQGQRGFGKVKAAPTALAAAPGPRRAVVVGISHYKNVGSLSYAAADAQAFAQFLESPAGGSVPHNNIQLLLDTLATRPRIIDAISWLWDATRTDDEAIIYFAGHGDIEPKHANRASKDEAARSDSGKGGLDMGFLLAYDARADRHYGAEGAVNSDELLHYVRAIVKEGATVWLITDACRSGNLLSGPVDDSRAIAPLISDWMGVASLVSSGPDQLSQEGRQWGGGHGVFTYYLLRGLAGAANSDSDQVVTLEEAARFVQDSVGRATHGLQVPQRSGNLGRVAAWVPQVQAVVAVAAGHEGAVAARGVGGAPAPDSVVLRTMERLSAALRQGALLKPDGENAWEIYVQLVAQQTDPDVLAEARSELRTAFQVDAREVMTDFMAGMSRQPDAQRIRDAATELGHVAELMGKLPLMAATLAAQRSFLEGYAYLQKGDYDAALKPLRQSVADDQGYAYTALGLALLATGQRDSSRQAFAKAIARAPRSPTPLLGQAFVSLDAGDSRGALISLDTAVAFAEPQASLQLARSLALLQLGRRPEAVAAYRRAQSLDARVTDNEHARALLPNTPLIGDRLARLRLVTSGRN